MAEEPWQDQACMEVETVTEGGDQCCEKKTTLVQWIRAGLVEFGFVTVGLYPNEDGIICLRGGEA